MGSAARHHHSGRIEAIRRGGSNLLEGAAACHRGSARPFVAIKGGAPQASRQPGSLGGRIHSCHLPFDKGICHYAEFVLGHPKKKSFHIPNTCEFFHLWHKGCSWEGQEVGQ